MAGLLHCKTLGGAIGTYDVNGTHQDKRNCNLFLPVGLVLGPPFESHPPSLLFFSIFLHPFLRLAGGFADLYLAVCVM